MFYGYVYRLYNLLFTFAFSPVSRALMFLPFFPVLYPPLFLFLEAFILVHSVIFSFWFGADRNKEGQEQGPKGFPPAKAAAPTSGGFFRAPVPLPPMSPPAGPYSAEPVAARGGGGVGGGGGEGGWGRGWGRGEIGRSKHNHRI